VIPSPWVGLVLALAVYRLCRLAGWDHFTPIARARTWLYGATVTNSASTNARLGVTNESVEVTWTYRRPMLAELLSCAFCLGWWISLAVYLAWLWKPEWTLYGAAPLALSAAAGLIAKNLDP
jgi:hypothetical protein